MSEGTDDILLRAIARNADVVLSLPSADGLPRHRPSRFLADVPTGFWVATPVADQPLIDALLASSKPLGVSFRSGHHKVFFSTSIRRQGALRVDAATRVPALLLEFPTDDESIKRCTRRYVRVPEGADLRVRVWRIGQRASLFSVPVAHMEVPCDVCDLSTGGLGLLFHGRGGHPPAILPDDRLRVELHHPRGTLVIEARVTHLADAPTSWNVVRGGVEFVHPPKTLDGGRTLAHLARIVSALQLQASGAGRPALAPSPAQERRVVRARV